MDNSKHPIRAFLVSLLILGLLGYGAFWAISKLLAQLASVTSDLGKAIVAAGATVVVATVSLVFGKIWEQRVKLQDDLRQRKLPIYEAHIQFMFTHLFSSVDKKTDGSSDDLIAGFRAFTAQLLVWGGPDAIKTWTAFRLHTWEDGKPLAGFMKFEAFVKALRTELGNKTGTLADGDLLKLFLNDFDAYKVAAIAGGSVKASDASEGSGESGSG